VISVKTTQTLSASLAICLKGALLIGFARALLISTNTSARSDIEREWATVPRMFGSRSNCNSVLPYGTLYNGTSFNLAQVRFLSL
jgi:hypothetical protein